jgi:TolB-like protein
VLGLLVGAGALFAWRRQEDRVPATASGPVGLAVLPFDVEGDTANAYFADGITNEIRGKLSALPALQVIARTSSNEYRRTTKPPEEIGRELGVQYLLTGTIHSEQGAGGARRVRVSPELIQVAEGRSAVTRWQQSFDTTVADVFDVQSAVASRVADKLGVVLSPPAQSQVSARPTQNIAAYEAYLRSVAADGLDPATIRRSLAAAQQAVALDSNFAGAWAQVSKEESRLYGNTVPDPAVGAAAQTAADRAIALAPADAEGYIARAIYKLNIASDVAGGVADYGTAVRLAPSSAEAVSGLAVANSSAGDRVAALARARQAAALDPRSDRVMDRLSRALLGNRQFSEARAVADRGLAIDPASLSLIQDRVMSILGDGDLAGARSALRDVPPTLDRGALDAYMANYFDLYWALDSADRALTLTLPPSAYDDDRGAWALIRAEVYSMTGDVVRARQWADSANRAFESQLRTSPDDFQRHILRAMALAIQGASAAAVHEGEHACVLAHATGDHDSSIQYCGHVLARIYVAAGDHPHALAQLDTLLATPYMISPKWLTIDPSWAPLKGDPHFERLIAQPVAPPKA